MHEQLPRSDPTKSLSDFEAESLDSLEPGEYWKNWTRKYETEEPGRWAEHVRDRVEFGYSTYDYWNFDSYIAGVIAHACERFALQSSGYPASMTAQEWTALCLSISKPLALWASAGRWDLNVSDREQLYMQVQEALRVFADNFGSFWD